MEIQMKMMIVILLAKLSAQKLKQKKRDQQSALYTLQLS